MALKEPDGWMNKSILFATATAVAAAIIWHVGIVAVVVVASSGNVLLRFPLSYICR